MRIAILGSRGVPNRYGGFEEMAAQVGPLLAAAGHEVTIYTASDHPERHATYGGCRLVYRYNPESLFGLAGQFIYDLLCLLHARREGYDAYLQLGYTTSAVWSFLWPKEKTATNMDGLEHARAKYRGPLAHFLRWSERRAAQRSKLLIADNPGIQTYLQERYPTPVRYIAYGTQIPRDEDRNDQGAREWLEQLGVQGPYLLHIGRVQPDNHVEEILQAADQAGHTLISIADYQTPWGRGLYRRFEGKGHIHLPGTLYDKALLNSLRAGSAAYLHGHSAGGTNPALLEAMGCGALVFAHGNVFNRAVLEEAGRYWGSAGELAELIRKMPSKEERKKATDLGLHRVQTQYRWPQIAQQYAEALSEGLK